jgi:hypothetical protein
MLILGVITIVLGFIDYKSNWFRFLKRWNSDDNAHNRGIMSISTGFIFVMIGTVALLLSS